MFLSDVAIAGATDQLKVKLHAPGNPVERRFGGWLGGSVVASLGTFHQLWISAEEWTVSRSPVLFARRAE